MTSPKKARTTAQADQSKLFIQTARDLGCDEDADTDAVMKRLAGQKRREPPDKGGKPKVKKPAK